VTKLDGDTVGRTFGGEAGFVRSLGGLRLTRDQEAEDENGSADVREVERHFTHDKLLPSRREPLNRYNR
jgi:hypothetical protein